MLRLPRILLSIALAAFAIPAAALAQTAEHLNPMIALHAKGLPVFGITHPSINARGGGGGGRGGRGGGTAAAIGAAGGTAAGAAAASATGATTGSSTSAAPEQPFLLDVATNTLAYRLGDFQYNSYSPATADRFRAYMEALTAQGGSVREHAFISKVPIVHNNVASAQARIIEHLNAGHAGVFMQAVETAAEVRQAIAAMRFTSKGGIRPDTGIDFAAKYWGLSRADYLAKADVWPINPNGELVVYAIVESRLGIENIREIAAEPGVASIVIGAGTLGGEITTPNAEGRNVRDQAGFDAAVDKILAACKEFKVPCGYPANNVAEVESLMAKGFSVFTMQSRNQAAFDAIEAGRKIAGRPLTPRAPK